MISGDEQLGTPQILYKATTTEIEALPATAGQIAYATDDKLVGYADGAAWVWIDPSGTADLDATQVSIDPTGIWPFFQLTDPNPTDTVYKAIEMLSNGYVMNGNSHDHNSGTGIGGGGQLSISHDSLTELFPDNAVMHLSDADHEALTGGGITALHSHLKIGSKVVDLTGLANGNTLVYNQGTDKFVPGEATGGGGGGPHNTTHQDGGSDEINVNGLSGLLADPQRFEFRDSDGALLDRVTGVRLPAGGWHIQMPGSIGSPPVFQPGFFALDYATLDHTHDPQAPTAHAASHQNNGADEIDVTGLSGLLADPQTPAIHTHSQYAVKNTGELISGAWHFQGPSSAFPPFSVEYTTKVAKFNADLLDGYHYNGIVPALAKNVNLYVAPGGTGDGSSQGSPLGSLTAAIAKLQGYSLQGCTIYMAAGTYNESVDVAGINAGMFDGLTIVGDTCELAGAMFLHGDNYTVNNASYGGAGAATIGADNSGAGGRMRVYCTRATTHPNFASAGVTSDNYVIVYNGASYNAYPVYSVSGYVITLATTATAPALNVAGRGFCIAPKVRIWGSSTADTYAMEVYQTGVRLKGLYLNGQYGGLRAYIGAIMAERCVFEQRQSANYFGAVHLTSLSFLFSRFDSITDAHNAIFGYWAGLVASYTAHANFGKCFACSIGGYALYCAAGTVYALAARLIGTGVGVYATARGYVQAGSTNASNWASTKYSPATSDVLGNSNASITYS